MHKISYNLGTPTAKHRHQSSIKLLTSKKLPIIIIKLSFALYHSFILLDDHWFAKKNCITLEISLITLKRKHFHTLTELNQSIFMEFSAKCCIKLFLLKLKISFVLLQTHFAWLHPIYDILKICEWNIQFSGVSISQVIRVYFFVMISFNLSRVKTHWTWSGIAWYLNTLTTHRMTATEYLNII